MKEYDKIKTIFKRDMEGSKKLIEGEWADETLEMIKDIEWVFTEKIDGTNIRVFWDGHSVSFGGRTDKAQIPVHLLKRLEELFSGEENAQIFEQLFGEKEVLLFGEGYGPKIQSGGAYRDDVDFILFDILIDGFYLKRDDILQIAKAFGIDVVPIVGRGTLQDAVNFVKTHPKSTFGAANMEGVVAEPKVELRDRAGKRIKVKIKWKDFL